MGSVKCKREDRNLRPLHVSFVKAGGLASGSLALALVDVLNIKFEFKEAEKLFVKIGAKIPYLLSGL